MKKILLCLSGIFLLFFISVNVQADVYLQSPSSTPTGTVSSISDPYFDATRVYDDFTLNLTSSITGITWWGLYSYFPVAAGDLSFTFTFVADNEGVPELESYLERYSSLDVKAHDGTMHVYSYNLPTPFIARAGETYWLSIYNEADGSTWGWQMAEDEGNYAYQTDEGQVSDVAFQLTYAPVPIPSAAFLLGSGLIMLAVIRLRFRK